MKHPVQDLIEVAAEVRHVRAERSRRPEDSSWFRRHGTQLDELAARFEQLVQRWALPEHREAWRAFRDGGGDPPEAAPEGPAPLWWGRAQTGSTLVIVPRQGEFLPRQPAAVDVWLDGELVERDVSWRQGTVSIGDVTYVETPRSSSDALEALRAFVGSRGEPPWTWARALLDDGMIDRDFGLTERGRRLVEALGGPIAAGAPRWTRWAAS